MLRTSPPWYFTTLLYFLSLKVSYNPSSPNYFGGAEGRLSIDGSAVNIWTMVCNIWRTTISLNDCLTWTDLCWRTRCRDERWVIPFLALSQTSKLKVEINFGAIYHLSANAVRPFATFLGQVSFLDLEGICIGNKWETPHRILSWISTAGR